MKNCTDYTFQKQFLSQYKSNMVSKLPSMIDTSSSSTTSASTPMVKFLPVVFSYSLSVKLDDSNSLLCRQQVSAAIHGHKLQRFLSVKGDPPLNYLISVDEVTGKKNPEYLDWEQ